MATNGPPVVAREGRAAFRISTSGFALSSDFQKAHSSAKTATHVAPLILLNDAERTSRVMPVVSVSSSRFLSAMSCLSSGADSSSLGVFQQDLRLANIGRD